MEFIYRYIYIDFNYYGKLLMKLLFLLTHDSSKNFLLVYSILMTRLLSLSITNKFYDRLKDNDDDEVDRWLLNNHRSVIGFWTFWYQINYHVPIFPPTSGLGNLLDYIIQPFRT